MTQEQDRDTGPPKRVRPNATPDARPNHKSADATTDRPQTIGCTGPTGWARRLAASKRLPPLACGCRDPLTDCTCTEPEPEPLSQRDLAAWAAAIAFLLDCGTTPLPPVEVLRALWRRGGTDRRLAQHVHQLTGGAVA